MPKAGITVEINQGQDLHEKLVNAIMNFITAPMAMGCKLNEMEANDHTTSSVREGTCRICGEIKKRLLSSPNLHMGE